MLPASLAAVRAGVHGHSDVSLGEGGRVVWCRRRYSDQLATLLFLLDEGHFRFRSRLSKKVVDTGLLGDRCRLSGDCHR